MLGNEYSKIIMPFTAIVGHEYLKKALILTIINPRIAGVLIRGPKGTAKSSIVRSLAQILPDIEVVRDCPYNCSPYHRSRMCDECLQRLEMGEELLVSRRQVRAVNLPISATEDRIVGGLDFNYALRTGKRRIEPGILAHANRGIIYIDDINLLDDYLGNLLLDAWTTGFNLIEREGISISHPAEFIVVGTMNPEEGDLRPQLLDRFGLCINVEPIRDLRDRMEIIKRQRAFEKDPLSFIHQWSERQASLRDRIVQARELLDETIISPRLLEYIASICLENGVAGHRADLLITETAKAIAALEGRKLIRLGDIHEAAKLVLPHRSRQPLSDSRDSEDEQEEGAAQGDSSGKKVPQEERVRLDNPQTDTKKLPSPARERVIKTGAYPPDNQVKWEEETDSPIKFVPQGNTEGEEEHIPDSPERGKPLRVKEAIFKIGKPFKVKPMVLRRDRQVRRGSGRRSFTKTTKKSGRYIRSTTLRKNNDLAFDATIRAAAPYQQRRQRKKVAITIETEDIREKVRERKIGNLLMFIVDASGSMGNKLMSETKGAIMSLLLDAYQKRDKVGFVAFRETKAEVLLPPTNSIELAQKLLEELPTGGRTPLAHGLVTGYELVMNHLRKDRNTSALMILISDCQANVGLNESRDSNDSSFRGYDYVLKEVLQVAQQIHSQRMINTLVIDVTKDNKPSSLGKKIALNLGARYSNIHDLKANGIVNMVKSLSHN